MTTLGWTECVSVYLEGREYQPLKRNWAGFGQRSSDDMSFTWTSYYELDEEEFEAAVAERQSTTNNDE